MARHFKLLIYCIPFVFLGIQSTAQQSYIYEGGVGGGTDADQTGESAPYFFEGAFGGGFTSIQTNTINAYFYKGANGGGFTSLKTSGSEYYFFRGGSGDGFDLMKTTPLEVYFYQGGDSDGFTLENTTYDGVTFYEGDIGQGYDMIVKCADFIWTGTVGTGWSVPENWNFTIVPDINRPVIIPAGAPNYPNVNAGILAIGDNPNAGEFECKSIWIQKYGELITRINNFVENYGSIQIDGVMQVKNSAPNALWNLENGIIRVSATGSLVIKP